MSADAFERLSHDTHELTREGGLLDRIEALLYEQPSKAYDGSHTSVGRAHSPSPWNDEAASVYFDIHADAFELHFDLLSAATGSVGSLNMHRSKVALRASINGLPDLCASPVVSFDRLSDCVKRVSRWVSRIRQLKDIDEEPRIVELNAECPNCGRQTLRVPDRARGAVFCSDELCVSSNTGKRSVWEPREWIDLLVDGKEVA